MTQQDLIQEAFYYLNTFKRHRALEQVEVANKPYSRETVQYHQLKQYQMIDSLELALRAIQKNQREITNPEVAASSEKK